MTTRLVISLALGAAVAICGYYGSKWVSRRRIGRNKHVLATQLAAVPLAKLLALQTAGSWVALCGTVFNVDGDPFFDARQTGIYSSWVGHDVTYLVLQLGLVPDAPDDYHAITSYLDRVWPVETLVGDDETAQRSYRLLREWFVRLHTRYEVIAQLSDRFIGAKWDALRADLLPADADTSTSATCPLGFGAKKVVRRSSRKTNLRTITFQGRRYDVGDSSLFDSKSGQLAYFVGHDVTYALAIQSTGEEDLDVIPERSYTFEEQLRLERFRTWIVHELTLVEDESDKMTTEEEQLHRILDESDGNNVENMKNALERVNQEQVNAVCARTQMTLLHKAVEMHRLDLVEMLVQAGANVEARAALYDGDTPLQLAKRFHFDDIAAHLESVN